MKIYEKKNLKVVGGWIVDETGEVVAIDAEVVRQWNWLETAVQKARFVKDNGLDEPEEKRVTIDGFVRTSEHRAVVPKMTVETPALDERTQLALRVADELDRKARADRFNELAGGLDALFEFVESPTVLAGGHGPMRLDSPSLGSILEADPDMVAAALASAVALADVEDADEEE